MLALERHAARDEHGLDRLLDCLLREEARYVVGNVVVFDERPQPGLIADGLREQRVGDIVLVTLR